jgi:hypothetical protein
MRQDADARHGDVNAYLERHAPALGVGRRLPELSEERKEEIDRKIKEADRARGSTYFQHAQSANDFPRDRFHAVTKASLVGGQSDNPWPQLPESSPWHGQHPDQYFDPREYPADKRDEPRQSFLRQSDDAPYVVGSTAIPQYPPAGGQADHSGKEPALGFDNPALEPEQGMKTSARAGGAAAPSALPPCNNDVEPAPPSSHRDKIKR